MKRYEKMSKKEIIDLYKNMRCRECNVGKEKCTTIYAVEGECLGVKTVWLNEEIVMRPRYEIYKTAEEAHEGFKEFCVDGSLHCRSCEYGKLEIPCSLKWLYDSEEVQG